MQHPVQITFHDVDHGVRRHAGPGAGADAAGDPAAAAARSSRSRDPWVPRHCARIADKSRYCDMDREVGTLVRRAGEQGESGSIVIMTAAVRV